MTKVTRYLTSISVTLILSCAASPVNTFGTNDGGYNDDIRRVETIRAETNSDNDVPPNPDVGGAIDGIGRDDNPDIFSDRVTCKSGEICRPATCDQTGTTPQGYCTERGTCKVWTPVRCPGECDLSGQCWITDAFGMHNYWGPMPGFADCIAPTCYEE